MDSDLSVLIDCDGVLVDNVEFEVQVAEILVTHLAEARGITSRAAKGVWDHELRSTRSDSRWHDYDFHANRLGIGDDVVQEAHRASLSRLQLVPGANETLETLKELNIPAHVVTDANDWVVAMKLRRFDLWGYISGVYSANVIGHRKDDRRYWKTVAQRAKSRSLVVIDNRSDNLDSARHAIGKQVPRLIHFEYHEHVHTLSPTVSPAREVDHRSTIVYSEHTQLQLYLRRLHADEHS